MSNNVCSIGVGKMRKVALSYLQDILLNLYNVKVKVESREKPFKSERELPSRTTVDLNSVKSHICDKLKYIFPSQDKCQHVFAEICDVLIEEKRADALLEQLEKIGKEAMKTIQEWGVENEIYVGVIPTPTTEVESIFEATIDEGSNRLYLHWDVEKLSGEFMIAVSRMAQILRDDKRQPTPVEYFTFQLAYYNMFHGKQGKHEHARCLGTPGFRPYTQTYMSLTDPGDGHVLGTTRFNDWMKGAIVHVEHLERPRHLPRENIESYRVPSIFDFSKVRLHVGPAAPTTYFLGRRIKDSGNFSEDFLKLVNITSASATAAFYQGAAECKVSMEGLTTSQAVRYMQALRGQIPRKKKQFLSAAWNLNQTIIDDYEQETPAKLTERMDIATRAIDITSAGGFNKVTWDGASDTYPSKCIMYQLTFEEALSIVHQAHSRGLVTYFSAGFKFNEIQHAVHAGIDGIGIGGAQVLRFMDSETGMHGPYMEENIPRILKCRDDAASSFRGQGVKLLARLDTMYFEGSISRHQNELRHDLFTALLAIDETAVGKLIKELETVVKLPNECNEPLIATAKRLISAEEPLLKEHFDSDIEWSEFVKQMKGLVCAKDVDSLEEEYESDPWLSLRKKYRKKQCEESRCIARQTSFDVYCKTIKY